MKEDSGIFRNRDGSHDGDRQEPVYPQWHQRPAFRIGEIAALIGTVLVVIAFMREYDNRLVRLEEQQVQVRNDILRLYGQVGDHISAEAHDGSIRIHAQQTEQINNLRHDMDSLWSAWARHRDRDDASDTDSPQSLPGHRR